MFNCASQRLPLVLQVAHHRIPPADHHSGGEQTGGSGWERGRMSICREK